MNKQLVKDFFIEAYENMNYDFMLHSFNTDYIDHSPANARSNMDAIGILKIVHEMFSDLKVNVLDLIAERDIVAARVEFEGTHMGICLGVPATGKRITWEVLENFRIEDGKIVETWGYWPDEQMRQMLQSE